MSYAAHIVTIQGKNETTGQTGLAISARIGDVLSVSGMVEDANGNPIQDQCSNCVDLVNPRNQTILGTVGIGSLGPGKYYINWGPVASQYVGLQIPVNATYLPTGDFSTDTVTFTISQGGVSPSISLSPTQVSQGGALTVTGSGFSPNGLVDIAVRYAGGFISGGTPSQTHADANGNFTYQVNVPSSAAVGTGVATAEDMNTSSFASQATFTVIQGTGISQEYLWIAAAIGLVVILLLFL